MILGLFNLQTDKIFSYFRDDTLYLPEPHLITEEAFNKHFSYEKYYHLLSSTKGRTHETAPIPQKENSENTPKKMLHEKLSALESPYLEDWEKMSGGRNDIFEDAATVLSSSTTMYELHTNYHLMSSVRSKISTIDSRDRRFHFWFLKEQGKNKISKIVESNEMKFKVSFPCISYPLQFLSRKTEDLQKWIILS